MPADVVGQLRIDLRVFRKSGHGVLGVVEGDADSHWRSEPVRLELELRDRAEVSASAVEGPEEIGVLRLARPDDLTRGGHELERQEVVAGQPVLAREPADAASEGKAANAGLGDDAGRNDEAVLGRCCVDVAQKGSALHSGDAAVRVHVDPTHPGEIDREAAVGKGLARDAVPAASHRNLEAVTARQHYRRDHVRGGRAARDDRRFLVDHRVPDGPGFVVAGLPSHHDVAGEGPAELRCEGCRRPLVENGFRHSPHLEYG